MNDAVRNRLLTGESVAQVAEALGLDLVPDESGAPMVATSWVVDDVEYPDAESAEEAAREFVDDFWDPTKTTIWATVAVWRTGLRPAECAYCPERATAHDAAGDPACAAHAATPADGAELEELVETARTASSTITVALDPEEPDCVDGDDHDWQRPLEIVGGIAENPGVWGHGGGVLIHDVCMRCGCGRHRDTWAQDPTDGTQGLQSLRYEIGEHLDEIDEVRL